MGQSASLAFQPSPNPSYKELELEGFSWIDFDIFEDGNNNNSSKRKIPIVYYEWKGIDGETPNFTLIYSYSTVGGFDLGVISPWLKELRDVLHVNVLSYEYTGFGVHKYAKPSEKNCYDDLRTVYNYLTVTKAVPSSKIILMGKGFGTGPIVQLASNLYLGYESLSNKKPIPKKIIRFLSSKELSIFKGLGGIILQSPMTSVSGVSNAGRLSLLGQDLFENMDKISHIKSRFLVVHGDQDKLVDVGHSKKLTKVIAENLWKLRIIEGAGHEDIETDFSEELLDDMVKFVDFISPREVKKEKIKRASTVPLQFFAAPDKIVRRWLSNIQMDKYGDKFLQAGYFDMLVIKRMDSVDLDFIGITDPGDREIILKSASTLSDADIDDLKSPLKQKVVQDQLLKLDEKQKEEVIEHRELPTLSNRKHASVQIDRPKWRLSRGNSVKLFESSTSTKQDPSYASKAMTVQSRKGKDHMT